MTVLEGESECTFLLAALELAKLRAALLELWLLEINLYPLKELGTIEKWRKGSMKNCKMRKKIVFSF